MDGFDADGRYLGEVALPEGIVLSVHPYIRGDQVVAVFEEADGAILVKRFRLAVD